MARRPKDGTTIEAIGLIIRSPVAALAITVIGALLTGYMVYMRKENGQATGGPLNPFTLLIENIGYYTVLAGYAVLSVGVALLAGHALRWCLSYLFNEHEEYLELNYGGRVHYASLNRAGLAFKIFNISIIAFFVLSIAISFVPRDYLRLALALTCSTLGSAVAAAIWWFVAVYRIHHYEQRETHNRIASPVVEHRQIMQDTTAQIEKVVEPLSSIEQLLRLPRGDSGRLPTSRGVIKVTNCVNGTYRVFWPPNSALMRSAKAVIRGRARYVAEHNAWFITVGYEKGVLLDLASI